MCGQHTTQQSISAACVVNTQRNNQSVQHVWSTHNATINQCSMCGQHTTQQSISAACVVNTQRNNQSVQHVWSTHNATISQCSMCGQHTTQQSVSAACVVNTQRNNQSVQHVWSTHNATISQCSMCGQHTTQQTLATHDVNMERAHTASFAAVLSRLALLEAENSALQVRVTTLEGISTSSSAPLSDLAQQHHHQPPPPPPPRQHPATPFPEFRPLPSPNPIAMHPSPSPLFSDQLAGSDPLSSLNATLLLSEQQGSVGTTFSSHPRAGAPPPPPASGRECVAVSTSNSFGPLASLAAVDTDQTTPTPSPDVQQTRASPDLNESGKGKPSTKGHDVTDRRLAPREQLFRSSLDDPRVSMLLVGDSVLKDIDIRKITPTSATMHKLCVPGITCEDLGALLRKQPPKVQMQEVIFHVGVNSVHHGPVSEKSWFDLGSLFRRAYPRGLPASVQHPSVLQGQSLIQAEHLPVQQRTAVSVRSYRCSVHRQHRNIPDTNRRPTTSTL